MPVNRLAIDGRVQLALTKYSVNTTPSSARALRFGVVGRAAP